MTVVAKKGKKLEERVDRIHKLAKRMLPDRPHHLALSATSKYRYAGDHRQMWEDHRVQRMTLTDFDRGILLTRPFFDILDEPDTPALSSAATTPKPDLKKIKTKISFKDYQNKKRASVSPTETENPMKAELEKRLASSTKPTKEASKEAETKRERREDGVKMHSAESRRILSTLDSHKRGPSPDSRKRAADTDDNSRVQKRVKSENLTPKLESTRTPRTDTSRQKESPNPHEKIREARSTPVNGRTGLSSTKDASRAASPKRSLGAALNGVKSGSKPSTPLKVEVASSKTSLPPLLSPLRLSQDDEKDPTRTSKKRPTEGGGQAKLPPKPPKAEAPEVKPEVKAKVKRKIPPLLSPTLPPTVEQELVRLKKKPSKGDLSQNGSQSSDSASSAKKVKPEAGEEVKVRPKETSIIRLKYGKRNVKRVLQILTLQPMSRRNALKKERSETPTPPPARKRPAPSDVHAGIATKKPRTSDASSLQPVSSLPPKPPAPSTPVKTATGMSRVASNSSVTATPRDRLSVTPAAPGSSTSTHENGGDVAAHIQRHTTKQQTLSSLGSKLKHSRDGIRDAARDKLVKNIRSVADRGRYVALGVEMIMSFMMSFYHLTRVRQLERRGPNVEAWQSLKPFLATLREETRTMGPVIRVLTLQLCGVCYEQSVFGFCGMDPSKPDFAARFQAEVKASRGTWKEQHDLVAALLEKDRGQIPDITPWTNVDEAVGMAFRVLRRWTRTEGVEWKSELDLHLENGG